MFATGEYDHLTFPQKLYSGDYFFVYYSNENNVVSLIYTTLCIVDKLESGMLDEDVVDNMGYYMLEAMERKNCKICDDSDSRFGEEH